MWPSVNVISMGDNYDGSSLLGSRGSTRQIYFRYSAAATFAMFGPVLASHPKVRPLPWRQGRGLPPIITTSSRYNKHFPEARAVITSPLMMAYIIEAVSEDDAEHVYCAHCTQSRVQFCSRRAELQQWELQWLPAMNHLHSLLLPLLIDNLTSTREKINF